MTPQEVVGVRPGVEELPGGAVAILKKAREACFFAWVTEGAIVKPVKVTAAAESETGSAVYEDRPHRRLLVKGRHHDGRRFVVQYLSTIKGELRVESAYCCASLPDRTHFLAASVAGVKAYIEAGSS